MRFRSVLASALVLAGLAGPALASRTETGPSHALFYTGSDPAGTVRLLYSDIETIHHRGARTMVTNRYTLTDLSFANRCARARSKVPGTIVVKHWRFKLSRGGFTVAGSVIGGGYQPTKLTGTLRNSRPGCDSGVLAFTVKPG